MNERSAAETVPLTGTRLSANAFEAKVTNNFEPRLVHDVLKGNLACAVFRNWVSPGERSKILKKFWAHPSRMEYVSNQVPIATYIGAQAVLEALPSASDYFDEVSLIRPAIYDVLGENLGCMGRFLNMIDNKFSTVRIANHYSNGDACPCHIRAIYASSQNLLVTPHDDVARLSHANFAEFEVAKIAENVVCSASIYLDNPSGGALRIWNIIPDGKYRSRVGAPHRGAGYPLHMLEAIDSIDVDVLTGDLCIFNTALIHGVLPLEGGHASRASIQGFLGHVSNEEIVYWA